MSTPYKTSRYQYSRLSAQGIESWARRSPRSTTPTIKSVSISICYRRRIKEAMRTNWSICCSGLLIWHQRMRRRSKTRRRCSHQKFCRLWIRICTQSTIWQLACSRRCQRVPDIEHKLACIKKAHCKMIRTVEAVCCSKILRGPSIGMRNTVRCRIRRNNFAKWVRSCSHIWARNECRAMRRMLNLKE